MRPVDSAYQVYWPHRYHNYVCFPSDINNTSVSVTMPYYTRSDVCQVRSQLLSSSHFRIVWWILNFSLHELYTDTQAGEKNKENHQLDNYRHYSYSFVTMTKQFDALQVQDRCFLVFISFLAEKFIDWISRFSSLIPSDCFYYMFCFQVSQWTSQNI